MFLNSYLFSIVNIMFLNLLILHDSNIIIFMLSRNFFTFNDVKNEFSCFIYIKQYSYI